MSNQILEKPVKYLTENDIASDIVYSDDKVFSEFDKIKKKLSEDEGIFFLVLLNNKDDTVKGIIDRKILLELLEKLELNINQTFDNNFIKAEEILSTDKIKLAKEKILKSEKGLLLVTNKEKKYLGKLRLKNFLRDLEQLKEDLY